MKPCRISTQHVRCLNLYEWQSKKILQDNGIAVQQFRVIDKPTQIDSTLQAFSPDEYVIKAQVLAGGRGKGQFIKSGMQGGIKLCSNKEQAAEYVARMLGDKLVTKQTTREGEHVTSVMVAEAVTIKREFYFAIVLDPSYDSGPILITSPYGGVDIEELSQESENIRKFTLPIDMNLEHKTLQRIAVRAFDLNLIDIDIINQVVEQIHKLYELFKKLDATQIEINPFCVTNDRRIISIDAKLNFDDNARFRQDWLSTFEAEAKETDDREAKAKSYNLNFVSMDGTIGCLVNGAGLAMATMDLLKLHGGQPANFLDVGGSVSANQISKAIEIISSDPRVKSIFINIFGGIVRCDLVAEGIVSAIEKLRINNPIVVRLQGSKMEEAKTIVNKRDKSDLKLVDDFDEASKLAVKMSNF